VEDAVTDRHRRLIIAIFVLSGAAGLVYEIVWSRQLVLVFGNTTQAIAAILTGYFGGMAIGNVIGGRLADRVRSPLRLYGVLELVLVVVVLVTPSLFGGIREVYRSVYSVLEGQPGLLAAVRFALALLALAPATVLMGATLPAINRHLTRRAADLGENFGSLYAANTLGAILGAALAGFVLIELVGLSASLVVGATGSATAGLLALVIGRRSPPAQPAPATRAAPAPPSMAPAPAPSPAIDLRRLSFVVAFVSGLTSLGYQTLWTRLLASGSGGVTYVFSAILVFFLFGLTLGAMIVTTAGRRGLDTLTWLGRAQLVIALLACTGTVFIAFRPFDLPIGLDWLLVVLPTSTAIGLSLPLASRLAASDDRHVGGDTGLVLGANTLGVALGTVAIPFVAMPTLGSPATVLVLALANVALAAYLVVVRARGPRRFTLDAAATVLVGTLIVAVGAGGLARDPSVVRIERGGHVFATAEDEIASVQAGVLEGGLQLWVGGTSMTVLTVDTRLMAVLPAIARPEARSLLVIAFGMGSSYRSGLVLGNDVEGVELVPSVPRMFGWFYPDAAAVLSDPRGRLVIADGRNHVELAARRFDMIVVDPPPPIESAGTGVLYSREFYQAAASRLTEGGVMMEWIPFGQTLAEFAAHVRTFRSVFPEVALALGPGGFGVFMLGSAKPVEIAPAAVEQVLARPGVVDDLSGAPDAPVRDASAWAKLIPSLVVAQGEAVRRLAGEGPIITDDRPSTEYFFIRRLLDPGDEPMSRESIMRALESP
jgi:spermidine synthase